MADNNFPTLKDLLSSYPVERLKAGIKDLQSSGEAAKNEMQIGMHERNKADNDIGGLEQIDENTSPEDKQKILDAKQHLDLMSNIPDSMMVGGVRGVPSAAEAILNARQEGKSIVDMSRPPSNGVVLQPRPGESMAKTIQNWQKIQQALKNLRTPF